MGRDRLERPDQPDELRHARPPAAVRLLASEGDEADAAGAQRGQGRRLVGDAARRPSSTSRASTRTASGRRCSRTDGSAPYPTRNLHEARRDVPRPPADGGARRPRRAPGPAPRSARRRRADALPAVPARVRRRRPTRTPTTRGSSARGLLDGKLRALEQLEQTAHAETLTEDDLRSWLGALESLRLALGTQLDVTEESYGPLDPSDPDAPRLALYHWLSWLQEEVVQALSGPTPPRLRAD